MAGLSVSCESKGAGSLSRLLPGQEFIIVHLNEKAEDRKLAYRLRQLGFQPGNRGICLYHNPGKGSLAFRICGSVIALRMEEAALIQVICPDEQQDVFVMLTGNPNVGKSTVFNRLTGMHQHTGNWPGKTVELAEGRYCYGDAGEKQKKFRKSQHRKYRRTYRVIDLPGTYSLEAGSGEEAVTTEALRENRADVVVAVCDASCLERSLRFALEVKEVCENTPVIFCINLCDEAERKGIRIDFELLEKLAGCPVVQTCAARGRGVEDLKKAIEKSAEKYEEKLLSEAPERTLEEQENRMQVKICSTAEVKEQDRDEQRKQQRQQKYSLLAADIVKQTMQISDREYWHRDYRIDRILISPVTGTISMMGMLFVLFWLTVNGANYPSELLVSFFGWLGGLMEQFLQMIHCPRIPADLWMNGIWKVSSWVVSVMLPPMAIFFPLFTILEDLGYLPRAAFHLDGCFKKCHACGKQALTMCMGIGCNAVGVAGCRIIDTEKERLMAVLTNALMPCNGRFPALIAIITMFFAGENALVGGAVMCLVILLAVLATFLATGILSHLLNGGKRSTFILELPPYRKPQFGQILIRSLLDRTLFVLSRAIMAAAPAGLVIWLLANIRVPGTVDASQTLLRIITDMMDTPASWIGLDGSILFAFILGFPANEIVLPAILMCYLSKGSLVEIPASDQLKILLLGNGWTMETAVCMLIFTLFHWPCATTCMTIRKETGSLLWTAAAFLIPAVCGCVLCSLVHMIFLCLGAAGA